ncbi:acyl-CoA dehydrogenase family protein [Mycolicibacterium sp. S3B2]|uniref:acyl-CoA dehydrogenase family protein n=1 Tax=Mycolicibacterium sp. S3B2 TaxID=3415120 RepID=UPI003C7BB284
MSEERELLRDTVAALVDKHATPEAVREAMASERGYDEALWTMLCEQVGAAALMVPEELGGAGGELADAAVVFEELGKALVPTPLWGTTLAELALLSVDDPDGETLGALAEGTAIGAVVFDTDERLREEQTNTDERLREEQTNTDERLREEQTGRRYVVHGDVADVVIATDGETLTRWTEFTAAPSVSMDPTRRLAVVEAKATATVGTDPGLADTAAILLAVEQIGAATRCLDLTVAYTKDRVQFGRPIGSFQALKHRMADLHVAVQSARAVVAEAVADPSPTSAALARLAASEAFSAVAAEAVQMHGGIAITWESDIQLYFKRAHGSAQLLGPPRQQLRRLESEVF